MATKEQKISCLIQGIAQAKNDINRIKKKLKELEVELTKKEALLDTYSEQYDKLKEEV